ncbi:hypothetical protein [Streptomyces sp. NPDC005181]|uniref:glycosyltransferase family protein n=1 Tax=Streptomyces sp. NPDC005181 TaxID=3156869 RepID=UPI0033A4CD2D
MISRPLVLHLSNESRPLGPYTGFAPAFTLLERGPDADANEGGLLRYTCVLPAAGDALPTRLRPDLVFVQVPQPHPWRARQVAGWLSAVGSPPVVVWAGDAWGGLTKQVRQRDLAWMRCADQIFSVAMGPQARMLERRSGRPVRYVPHVVPEPFLRYRSDHDPRGVSLIGNRLTYCGVELIPGDRARQTLVRQLQRLPEGQFSLYGAGWRGPGTCGQVPFQQQMEAMRRSLVTVGWDRYTGHTGYFSDRLPIAMNSGRVPVSSLQPGLDWLPGPDDGLHLLRTPAEAAARVRDLLAEDPARLLATARRLRQWTAGRLTQGHALCHMLGRYLPLPEPPADPWGGF